MTGTAYLVNTNDIAGPYSGIVFGISNTIATIPGLVSPYIASILTTHVNVDSFLTVIILFDFFIKIFSELKKNGKLCSLFAP